ncbi:MAG: hypothetical protein H0X12_00710 [Nocardioides sp.]|nr:hypothetical protein [Nocardioides sp.]
MPARHRLAGVAAASGIALVLLAGCGGDHDPAVSTSAEPSPSASPTPTPAPTPAASGPVLKVEGVQVNVPVGWKRLDPLVSMVDTAGDPVNTGTISLSSRVSFGSSLDELAKVSMEQSAGKGETRREQDIDLAGLPAYHYVDTRKYRESPWRLDEYGAVHNGQVVQLIMNLDRGLSEAEREQIRTEVLASVVWK